MPYVTVLSGAQVSSQVTLDAAGGFAVFVASHASRAVHIQFATSSAGNDFHTYENPHTGNAWVIASGTSLPAAALVARAITPWIRIRFGSAAVDTCSACVVPVR